MRRLAGLVAIRQMSLAEQRVQCGHDPGGCSRWVESCGESPHRPWGSCRDCKIHGCFEPPSNIPALLVILDGSKALHKAVTQTFGSAALMHRCQVRKLSNILEHLPEGQRLWARAIVTRASK